MNTDVMFSSKSFFWETPQEFFEKLDKEYNFSLDVCAIYANAKCDKFFSPEIDGLKQEWTGVCWMNPPYGREIGKWVAKAYSESIKRENCIVVALLPARTDTKWFHDYIYMMKGVEVKFIKGRLKFGGGENSAPFPSMVVVFNKKNNE